MQPTEAAAAILANRGKFATVTFTPRRGPARSMNFRLDVTKHLRGGPCAYDPVEHGLIWVYAFASRQPDGTVKRAGYRSIPVEGITALSIAGQRYTIRRAA